MTIKLTYQQAEALFGLMQQSIIPLVPADMAEKLVYVLLKNIFKRLRNKLEAKIKDGYSLSLSHEEVLAYYLYFNNRYLGECYRYEANFIQTHLNEINKLYA